MSSPDHSNQAEVAPDKVVRISIPIINPQDLIVCRIFNENGQQIGTLGLKENEDEKIWAIKQRNQEIDISDSEIEEAIKIATNNFPSPEREKLETEQAPARNLGANILNKLKGLLN